jgi:hypothetical protein
VNLLVDNLGYQFSLFYKDCPVGSESPNVDMPLSPLNKKPTQADPKADKPPSPHATKVVSQSPKPPSHNSAEKPPGDGGAPSSSTHATPSQNPAVTPPRQEARESPKVAPPGPNSYGHGATGGHQPAEGSSGPQSRKQQ